MPPRPVPTLDDLLARRCRSAYAAQKRRARADGATLDYTADDLLRLATRQALLCDWCRAPLPPDVLRFDHGVPVARGGRHELWNLTVICDRCNRLKGRLTAAEFGGLRYFLATLHPAAAEDVRRRLLHGAKVYMRGRKK